VHHLRELRGGLRLGVGLEDAGLGLDHLSERPEGDALAVRERPPLPPARQARHRIDALEQLPHEARFADSGNADERHELRLPLASRPRERVHEHVQLLLASHERGPPDLAHVCSEPRPRLNRLPHGNRVLLSFRVDRLRVPVVDRAGRRTIRGRVDENPVLGRSGLDAGGGVHDVARGHPLALAGVGAERHERLAGGDPDPHLELAFLLGPVAHGERGPHRAFRIVLVRDRSAEERHDGVADELLDRAAEALELAAQPLVVTAEEAADVLGIHRLRAVSEVDEVAEEAGDDFALLAPRGDAAEFRPASRAEAGVFGVLAPAVRTDLHASRV
jgi:hypothetical protein